LATDLHHPLKVLSYPHLQFVESNVVPLCRACHTRQTALGF